MSAAIPNVPDEAGDPEKSSILVIDDDPDVVRFLEACLRWAGYEVRAAYDGEEGLQAAVAAPPDLVLLDIMMPKLDGFEVAERLRRDARTSSCSIIMLSAKGLSTDKVLGLASGADDYIIKPFDGSELLARVKRTLLRAREMRAVSPLTGLPGNMRVQEEILRRVAGEVPFGLLYADLDHFKAFNDHYGFVRGDEAIHMLARVATEVMHEIVGPQGFVGHVGGDDLILLVPPQEAERVCAELCARFDQQAPALYDPEDVERGYIEVNDRQGNPRRFLPLTLSIGVATTTHRRFNHYGEAVAVATEMKQVAKRVASSSFVVDARTH